MTSSLFNEALDDAKAIKVAAEERAKQQLLETMSPRLKKIVENTINQQMGLSEEDNDALTDEYADDELDKLSLNDSDNFSEDESEMYQEKDDIEGCGTGMYQESQFSNKGKNSKQQNEAKEVLNILLNKDVLKRNLKNEVNNFEKDVKSLKRMFNLLENHKVNVATVQKVDQTLLKLVENSKNIASNDIIKNQTEIKKQFSISLQELNQMTKRRNNILAENYSSLSRRSRRLFEAEDEQEDDDMGGDMGDMGDMEGMEGMEGMGGDDDMGDMGDMGDMEGMEGMGGDEQLSTTDAQTLQAIAQKIENMLGGGGDEDMGDMGDEDMGDEDMDDEDMGDEDDEEESSAKKQEEWARRRGRLFAESEEDEMLADSDEQFEVDDMAVESDFFYESDKKKGKVPPQFMKGKKGKKHEDDDEVKESQRRRGDVFLEIDENMLKREIARMKRLREGDAEDMASHFGGGKIDREMFVDSDDGDLNGNVGNLGSFPSKGRLKEGRFYNSNSSTRLLEGKVQSYERALTGMKGQLSEMTLFNAKLLYANKLMQNRDLTTSQQRHIVESLDQAKTLREAKLLFEGLSKSLLKGTGRSGSLNESANRRITGGASRSTSSAQSSQNRIETDRWALLAGIKK